MTLHKIPVPAAAQAGAPVEIRAATAADIPDVARILFEAYDGRPGALPSLPDLSPDETAMRIARHQIGNRKVFGVVAAVEGAVIGSAFLTEGDRVAGLGPISVAPAMQRCGAGRMLVRAMIERGAAARGIRLVQDSLNSAALALGVTLGFRVREPLALVVGRLSGQAPGGVTVRPMTGDDLPEADMLARRVLGHVRHCELQAALERDSAVALVRRGRIIGYMSRPDCWLLNHAVAESQGDLMTLVAAVGSASARPLGLLLPVRNGELFGWCLESGLEVVRPMTLMTRGDYAEPRGGWLPSALY